MRSWFLIVASAVGLAQAPAAYAQAPLAGAAGPVFDQSVRQMCWEGSRQACIRFGMFLGRNQQFHADWRRTHPDWWEWERW